MKKISRLLFFFSFLVIHPGSHYTAQNLLPGSHINFGENWKFHFGNTSDHVKDFNYSIANIFSKTRR